MSKYAKSRSKPTENQSRSFTSMSRQKKLKVRGPKYQFNVKRKTVSKVTENQ